MANELNIALGASNTGLTIVGKVRTAGGAQEGSDTAMTETGATGFYSGSFALGAVADGVYSVEFEDTTSGALLGDGELSVKGNAEYELHDQNDFNPATDTVANVTLVGTTTTNTDMRGTDGANTTTPNTIAPDNASITTILADTNELQLNQGNWTTATTTISSNMRGTDNASTFDNATDTVITDSASRTASQADVSALATSASITALNDFNPATTEVTTDTASREASKATTTIASNMVSEPDNASITTILADTNELQLNQGDWTTANVSGLATEANATTNKEAIITQGDIAWTTGSGGDSASTIYSYFTSGSNEDAFKADVANLDVAVSTRSTFNPTTDVVANVTLVGTTTTNTDMVGTNNALLASSYVVADNATIGSISVAVGALNDISVADIEATTILAKRVDVDGLNNFDPSTDVVANVALVDVTTENTDQRGTDGAAKPSNIAPLY